MTTEGLSSQSFTDEVAACFDGTLSDVTDAHLTAALFLDYVSSVGEPSAPDNRDDVLLVITELSANATPA